MPSKWINPAIGLLAGILTYMLVSGDRLGVVGVVTFVGTFAIVWLGLDYLTARFCLGRAGENFAPDDAA